MATIELAVTARVQNVRIIVERRYTNARRFFVTSDMDDLDETGCLQFSCELRDTSVDIR